MVDEKIEVRANKIGDALGKEYYHTFIVYTDQRGTEYYLRGGPSGNPGSAGSSSELSGGSSGASGSFNSRRSSDSSSGQPYGPITTEYGNYTPRTIDWNPGALSVVVARGNNLQAVYQQLQSQMNAIRAANIPYNPLNENSNATVSTGLKNVGITPQLPNDIWAPGFGTQLIQPNGLRSSLDAPIHAQTQQANPYAAFDSSQTENIAVGKDPNPETVVVSKNSQPNPEDSVISEDQQFNNSIAEKIRASRERYPLPQLRAPQALNMTIADRNNPPQSPRESLASIQESNPSLHDTLNRLHNAMDELDRQTLARQPQSSPAQRLYEKTAQSVTQQTGLTPSHDRFEPVLAAKLLAEHSYNQAASIIAAGSPRLNEVNATFGNTTADRQLAELMRQGEQTLQAMRPEQQKQQDQMEQG